MNKIFNLIIGIFKVILKILKILKINYYKINNKLLSLLIISIFLLGGVFYYYKINNNPKIIEKIKKEKIKKTQKTQKKLKTNLIPFDKQKNIFNKDVQEIQKNILNKTKQKITKILNQKIDKIYQIDGDKNLFIIKSKNKNYIYNQKLSNLEKIKLNIPIIYAKKYNNTIFFVTKKGIFSFKNNKLNFFSNFTDFVILNGNYIGIIKKDEKQKKENFNFSNKSGNLIILFSPKNSNKQLLYQTDFDIKKILLENKQVILIDNFGKKYLLKIS